QQRHRRAAGARPRTRQMTRRLLTLLPLALLGSCQGIQTVGDNAGRDAGLIRSLLVTFTIVTAIFFIAVMAFLIAAYWRRGGKRQDGLPDEDGVSREPSLRLAFFFWVGAVGGAL